MVLNLNLQQLLLNILDFTSIVNSTVINIIYSKKRQKNALTFYLQHGKWLDLIGALTLISRILWTYKDLIRPIVTYACRYGGPGLQISMDLSETFRIDVNMDFTNTYHGDFLI